MRSSKNQTTIIEQFIDFKLQNSQQSTLYCRLYFEQKKLQKKLNIKHKQMISRQQNLMSSQRNFQKYKQHIWDQLIGFSNAVEKVEKQRYNVIEATRQCNLQILAVITNRKQMHRKTTDIQNNLLEVIQRTKQQSQFYFANKVQQIKLIKIHTDLCQQKIQGMQPNIKQYYNKQIQKQIKVKQIDNLRVRNQDAIKQLWNGTEVLQTLKQKMKKSIRQREEKQARQILERRSIVQQLFQASNNLLSQLVTATDSDSDSLLSLLKQKLQDYQKQLTDQSMLMEQNEQSSEKMKKIKYVFGGIGQTPAQQPSQVSSPLKSALRMQRKSSLAQSSQPALFLKINDEYAYPLRNSLQQIKQQLQQIQNEELILIQKQKQQNKQQNELDQQIQHLRHNIHKIESNLK